MRFNPKPVGGHSPNSRCKQFTRVMVALACLAPLLLLLVFTRAVRAPAQGLAQQSPNLNKPVPSPEASRPPDANQVMLLHQQHEMQTNFEAANLERKKQLTEDSAHLLALATELKAEVDKTNKDTLSLTVIRKANQIEKLAHDVREKMRLVVGQS